MTRNDTDPASVLNALRSQQQSVLLSTVGEHGDPHSGYTPFIFDDQPETDHHLLIFVSQLALHTRDLQADPRVCAMLIADESASEQIFARTRVSYQCRAVEVARDHARYEPLLDRFADTHGKMIGLLRTLPDFVLFRLEPLRGQFVMGFGQAFKLTGDKLDQFEHARRA